MDFQLTDEQRLIQDTVRSFVDERVLPVAVQNDIEHRLDLDLIEGLAELGILGIVIPEEYGGAGLDYVAEALACEEIERGEAAFRTLISVHVGLNSLSLLRYGTEEQKQRWLVPQARGEKLACFGLTEPAAGSDVASMRTTARREGDVYVLNGQKNWISYASVADHALVFAKTDPAGGHKGISAFVLEQGMQGLSARDTEHKLGVWAGSTGELFFALIAEVGPVRATVITYVNPAVAAVVGVLLLNEHLTAGMVLGFALVLAGCVLATARTPEAVAEP